MVDFKKLQKVKMNENQSNLEKKKILIIGGLGFIGINLIEELLVNERYEILVFEFPGVINRIPNIKDKIKIYYGDFLNKKDLEIVFNENRDIYLVIHSLSTTNPGKSNLNIQYDINSNLNSTINLLDLMQKYSIKKLFFFSSGGTVYGENLPKKVSEIYKTEPICSYGIVKLTIEKYLYLYNKLYDLNYIIFRLSNPYGMYHNSKRQGLINIILRKIFRNESIEIWGDGTIIRDYIYIKDLVKIIVFFIEKNVKNGIYNLGSGDGYSINNLIDIIKEEIGPFEVKYINKRKFDVPSIILNISKINSLVNFDFINIKDGIRETYNWLKKDK